jgi:hypothetical protein
MVFVQEIPGLTIVNYEGLVQILISNNYVIVDSIL